MSTHPIEILSERFPQLLLPVREGMNQTEEYKSAVLRGEPVRRNPEFSMNPADGLESFPTPAGEAEILYLESREDFEHALRALAYRCEPKPIPASLGATAISGLIDWGKLRAHEDDFAEFISDKKNYLSSLIILSSGEYSAVSAADVGLDESEWRKKSVVIRRYHELAHFVSGRLFPQNKEAVRDEVIADLIGILAAFGHCREDLSKLFLGIEGEEYRPGGRLENYVAADSIESVTLRAKKLVSELCAFAGKNYSGDVFDFLIKVETEQIGI